MVQVNGVHLELMRFSVFERALKILKEECDQRKLSLEHYEVILSVRPKGQ
jgi:hypothetical protein